MNGEIYQYNSTKHTYSAGILLIGSYHEHIPPTKTLKTANKKNYCGYGLLFATAGIKNN